jgi:predicted phage terminase large subunit-like protein
LQRLLEIKKYNAEKSTYLFGKDILGYEDFDPNVHQEWEFHLKGAKRLKLMLVPRDHFKSSFFTITYPLQQLCIDKTKRFLLSNAVYGNAQKFLLAIKTQIENNPKLAWWNIKPGDTWSTEELTVKRSSIHKEPSISIAGIGSQLPSQHYDTIVWDDLVNEKNITSKEQADKVIAWWKDSLNLLEPGGLGIMLGTRWSYRDLYEYIIQNLAEHFDIIVRSAYRDEVNKIPYFPKRFSREYLEELKALEGPYRFSLQYLNKLTDEEDAIFKKDWILEYSELPKTPLRYFMTVDPALSDKADADYSVIMTAAVDTENNLYVVDYYRDRVAPKVLIDKIFEKAMEFNPANIGIETVAFQKVLSFWLNDEMRARNWFLNIEELHTSNKAKPDRILALQPRFAAKTVFIRHWMIDLKDELMSFKYPESNQLHDDVIDALAYMLEIIYKPLKVAKVSKAEFGSIDWLEEKFGKKVAVSTTANPFIYGDRN